MIGRGFTQGGNATVERISIGGTLLATNKIADGTTIRIANDGSWGSSLVVPINAVTTVPGIFRLAVIDTNGLYGEAYLVIPRRTIVLDPDESRKGTIVTVTGTGFPANSGASGSEHAPKITIFYKVSGVPQTVATTTPDFSGKFSTTFSVPSDAPIPSITTVLAEFSVGETIVSTAAAHAVPPARLTLGVAEGTPGTLVALQGHNFRSFYSVRSLTVGGVDVLPSPSPSTDAIGSFSATFVVPGIAPDTIEVVAESGGLTAKAAFTVTYSPALPVYPLPTANAAIEVSPSGGSPGDTLLVTVTGFPGFTQLTGLDIGDLYVRRSPAPITDARGLITTTIVVPQLARGPTVVSASVGEVTAWTFFEVVR